VAIIHPGLAASVFLGVAAEFSRAAEASARAPAGSGCLRRAKSAWISGQEIDFYYFCNSQAIPRLVSAVLERLLLFIRRS
jgi:hypothetical protein